jgi:hypothetical protein
MAQARYDAVADFYASGFDSIDDPATWALLDLLGPVAGLRVLDVACGHAVLPVSWPGAGRTRWASTSPAS